MLVLQRIPCGKSTNKSKSDILIYVGEMTITVRAVNFTSQGIKIGIDAPEHVRIVRADAISQEQSK